MGISLIHNDQHILLTILIFFFFFNFWFDKVKEKQLRMSFQISGQFDVSGCGQSKGCLYYPTGCVPNQNCQIQFSFLVRQFGITFESWKRLVSFEKDYDLWNSNMKFGRLFQRAFAAAMISFTSPFPRIFSLQFYEYLDLSKTVTTWTWRSRVLLRVTTASIDTRPSASVRTRPW